MLYFGAIEPIGFLDYQDRYAGKFAIKEHEDRWYLYTAVSKTQEGRSKRIFFEIELESVL